MMGREITELQRIWLAHELDAWRDSGVVTDDQGNAWSWSIRTTAGLQALYLTCATVVLAGVTVGVVVLVRRRTRHEVVPVGEVVRRLWLPCGMVAVMAALGFSNALTRETLVPTLVANLGMLVLAD